MPLARVSLACMPTPTAAELNEHVRRTMDRADRVAEGKTLLAILDALKEHEPEARERILRAALAFENPSEHGPGVLDTLAGERPRG